MNNEKNVYTNTPSRVRNFQSQVEAETSSLIEPQERSVPHARNQASRSYRRERDPDFGLGIELESIYLRMPEFTQSWHIEVGNLLHRRYELAGFARSTFMKDFSMLRHICKERHPRDVYLQDLEEYVLGATKLSTRAAYIARVKSVWNSLRILGIIPNDFRPDEGLPKTKEPRYTPRPISKEQAIMLMTQAEEPMREWFMFACLAGLRAIEISRIQGNWLEQHAGEYFLRVLGKGNTELLVPLHPKLVQIILSKKTQGRLYTIEANYLSRIACAEMRRLGIFTKKNGSNRSRLSFHSCRHFFATSVLAASNNLITTQRLMRHASPVVTARYADLVNHEERAVIQTLLDDIEWSK